jgi:hypothetical protein
MQRLLSATVDFPSAHSLMCRRLKHAYNVAKEGNLMPEWTPQRHLQEAFRKELFRLINQYLSFPDDATHGKFMRTLVMYQQAWTALETCASTLLTQTGSVNMAEDQRRGKAKSNTGALRLKEKSVLPMADTNLAKSESGWRSRS